MPRACPHACPPGCHSARAQPEAWRCPPTCLPWRTAGEPCPLPHHRHPAGPASEYLPPQSGRTGLQSGASPAQSGQSGRTGRTGASPAALNLAHGDPPKLATQMCSNKSRVCMEQGMQSGNTRARGTASGGCRPARMLRTPRRAATPLQRAARPLAQSSRLQLLRIQICCFRSLGRQAPLPSWGLSAGTPAIGNQHATDNPAEQLRCAIRLWEVLRARQPTASCSCQSGRAPELLSHNRGRAISSKRADGRAGAIGTVPRAARRRCRLPPLRATVACADYPVQLHPPLLHPTGKQYA